MFANDPEDLGSIPGRVIPKTLKMVLDTALLNTQRYKVRIKGKVEQSKERSRTPLHFGVVAIEKGAFWSPSAKGRQLYFLLYNTCPAPQLAPRVPDFGWATWHTCWVEYKWRAYICITLDLRVLLIYDQRDHLVYMPGDLAKTRIIHIARRDPMSSKVHQGTGWNSWATSPSSESLQ